MGWFSKWSSGHKNTADTGMNRLRIIVDMDRQNDPNRTGVGSIRFDEMRKEVMQVVGKYIHPSPSDAQFTIHDRSSKSVLDITIELPDHHLGVPVSPDGRAAVGRNSVGQDAVAADSPSATLESGLLTT